MNQSRALSLLAAGALFAAACGAATATNSPRASTAAGGSVPLGESPTPAGPTPTATPAAPAGSQGTASGGPAPFGQTVTVVLSGGPDAGSYSVEDDPNCTVGIIGPEGWGLQWSNPGGSGKLSSIQLVSAAKGREDDPNAMFSGTVMLLSVGVGPLTGGNSYEIDDKTDNSQDKGSGSVQVQDNGDTAVIHATGTTADGVGIDVTVSCPSVTRA